MEQINDFTLDGIFGPKVIDESILLHKTGIEQHLAGIIGDAIEHSKNAKFPPGTSVKINSNFEELNKVINENNSYSKAELKYMLQSEFEVFGTTDAEYEDLVSIQNEDFD